MPTPRSRFQVETAAILLMTAIGAVVRLWSFGRLGLQHFDEGVYALGGLWIAQPAGLGAIDPTLIPYAPPGFPILVGLAYLLLGFSDLSAIAVSILCGIATVPVAAWLARRTFGPGAGAAAASFVALAGPHVAFSRMALTDVPFLLAWLVCLGLGARFVEAPGFGRSVAFGLSVGIAQNLKYNGWLAGAIVALVAVLDYVLARGDRRRVALRAMAHGIVAVAVAAGVYCPWYAFVEHHGGYASLLAHHRSYMGGAASWWSHWTVQMGQAIALSGGKGWGLSAWALAALAAMCVLSLVEPEPSRRRRGWILAGAIAALAPLLDLVPTLPWWLCLAALPWLLRDPAPATRVLGVWWLVLAVGTPLYHPYARLWLPEQAAGWLVMGGLMARLLDGGAARFHLAFVPPRARPIAAAWLALCLLAGAGQTFLLQPHARALPGLLAASDSLRRAVDQVPAQLPEGHPPLAVLARPPVTFYLAGRVPVQVAPNLRALRKPTGVSAWALLDAAQVRQEMDLPEARALLAERWEWVHEWPTELNGPTLLDVDPSAVSGHSPHRSAPLWLLRPRGSRK